MKIEFVGNKYLDRVYPIDEENFDKDLLRKGWKSIEETKNFEKKTHTITYTKPQYKFFFTSRWDSLLIKKHGLIWYLSDKIGKFLWSLKIDIKNWWFNHIYYDFIWKPFISSEWRKYRNGCIHRI